MVHIAQSLHYSIAQVTDVGQAGLRDFGSVMQTVRPSPRMGIALRSTNRLLVCYVLEVQSI
jgi:hypothetical protein